MDLSQLIYTRLSADEELISLLAKYGDQCAIFNSEFPVDVTAGWNGTQYPRIEYRVNMQTNIGRNSAGTLTLSIYTQKDPAIAEQIESCVRRSLKDVLMKPSEQAPFCVAWGRTEPFAIEGTSVLGKDIAFDILEYPDTFTADPDPAECMANFIKEAFPQAFVVGVDEVNDIQVATEDEPIIYVRTASYQTDHLSMALAWINCNLSIHVIAPTADARTKWVRLIMNAMMMAGEAILSDITPLRFTGMSAVGASDYLANGQISLQTQYTLPRYRTGNTKINHIGVSG